MSQATTTVREEAKQQARPARVRWPAAFDLGLHAGVALCVFASLLLFYGLSYPLHHDLAGSVLSGRLAVTLGDSFRNYSIYFPPAEKFWFSLAARLSDLTGLRLDLTIVTMTGAMVLFGAGLAYHIRRVTVGASPLFLIVSVAVLVIAPILFKNVFGLREHLVILGLWPYLVFRASDTDGTRIGWKTRVVLGLWMGATLLFKYLYAVVVALVEIADALVQRRPLLLFRIENVVSGTIVFLYLFLWLGIDPSQRAAIGAMFSAIDANLVDPVVNWLNAAMKLCFAGFLLIASKISRVPMRGVALALAVTGGAVSAAWSQERWYSHHLFPIIMAYALWWWIGARQFRWWAHAALALYLTFSIGRGYSATGEYHERIAELDRAVRDGGHSVVGKRVGVLNMHPSPYNEYLVSHDALRWTPMMNNAYVSAELEPLDTEANDGKLASPVKLTDPGRRLLHDQMVRLWEDMPPDVLILDRTSSWPLRHIDVDWMRVFSQDPRFMAIMAKYRPVQVYNGKLIKFTYYVRAD